MSNLTNLTLSPLPGPTLQYHADHTAVGLALGLALPPAIAYFPQRARTDPKKLEDEFREYDGPVYFSKGL